MHYTREQRNKMVNELIRSAKIFSDDFVKALDEKDRQKTLEVMIDHITYQVQFTMNLTNEVGTPKHIDDIKLEVMKKQLFGFFGNLSE